MIKDPSSLYEGRRSDKLLKVKVFLDSEAKVLKHEKGTGRCSFMMGKMLVRDPKLGCEFRIGSGFTDKQRNNPPKLGSMITYKYQNLTNAGIPRFPIYLRDYAGM